MSELGVAEKIHTPTFIVCQNMLSLFKNLKFMTELGVDKKIHTLILITGQNIL